MAQMGSWHGEPCLEVAGRRFVALAGEVHNSTSSDVSAMEAAWQKAHELGIATLAVPVTWELLEPEEGVFDFSQADSLIAQARTQGGHLILLWFGTWKNAQGFYAPEWVKRDQKRFWRAEPIRGQRQIEIARYHATYGTFSALSDETAAADARAFAALMRHLRESDGKAQTVVAVQVENECGLMCAAREHSELADRLFAQEEVPEALLGALKAHLEELPDDVRAVAGKAQAGSWEEAFGSNAAADELFQAWHTARFVEKVASAGRQEYALPLLANCWLDKGKPAGSYPSGGPVARMMPVWKAAAPSIDIICPDIYVRSFCDVCDSYHTDANPLSIVETATHSYLAPRAVWAICHHHAPIFAPFGFEEMGEPFTATQGFLFGMDVSDPALQTPQDPVRYRQTLELLQELVDMQTACDLAGSRLDAAIAERGTEQALPFGQALLKASFTEGVPGAVAVLDLGADSREGTAEALILAYEARLSFASADGKRPYAEVLKLEEGRCPEGVWQRGRRLNGDELQILSCTEPTLLKVRVLLFS